MREMEETLVRSANRMALVYTSSILQAFWTKAQAQLGCYFKGVFDVECIHRHHKRHWNMEMHCPLLRCCFCMGVSDSFATLDSCESASIQRPSRPNSSTGYQTILQYPSPFSSTHNSPNCSSYLDILATLSALALLSSNLSSTHSSTSFLANSNPTTRWPMQSTCALFESTLRSTL